ncbi:MAG: Gfo/Idh/MocA family oxidoreductase [Planctomycetota bacterium]|nr:Gfo/Idh/MocA family oxidoreductase [Planctomycetota bacterium]
MRVAVVGIRGMGKGHLRAAKRCSVVREVAGCDLNPEVRAKVGAELDVSTFASVDELFASFKPDALVVATAPNRHAEVIRAGFDRGLPVLTEKPICDRIEAARGLVEEAGRRNLPFQCCFQVRYSGLIRAVRSLLESGDLGTLTRIGLTQYSGSHAAPGYMSRERTGGIFYEKLCHQVDLFRLFFGEPERALAVAAPNALAHYGIEDNVTAVFAFPGGRQGVIAFDTRRAAQVDGVQTPGRDFEGREAGHFYELCFTGDRGTAVYDAWSGTVDVMRFNHRGDLKTEFVRRIDLTKEFGADMYDLLAQDGDFYAHVSEGRTPRYPASDALKSMEWSERAERSLASGGAWVNA